MDSTQAGRKRKSSCFSNPPDDLPVSRRTRHSLALWTDQDTDKQLAVHTPQKRRKKVRFSDPGPRIQDAEFDSTGLTPAMRRTSFADAVSARRGDCTPSRRGRRTSSAPTPRSRRSFDPVAPFDGTCSERRMQFTPLRQILDMRTQRRIRRIGLSDEITHIEREKRETASFEKTLRALMQERDALRQEMDALRQSRSDTHFSSPEATMLLEPEIETGRRVNGQDPSSNGDGDSFIINDSAILSNSPDFRGIRNGLPPVTDSLMLFETPQPLNMNSSTQAQTMESTELSDVHALTIDLEAARNEKKQLFNACRSRVSGLDDPTIREMFRHASPPPDFFDQILSVLTVALSRASDAAQALEGINQEFSNLGFTGTDADDVIADMRKNFRSARLELESAIPGETAGVGLENGKATLSALVRRVETLAKELGIERDHHTGSLSREKALRGQFNALLARYETAANKINTLEESIASSAGDMLHTRMRMQDLEREGQEQAIGIDRLNAALDKYHEDLKVLEDLISSLEQENMTAKEDCAQQISDLESQVADEQRLRSAAEISASESESRIRELEETVEQNRIRACDLTAQIESLEKEHQKAVENLETKTQDHVQRQEREIGTLNVRISDLSTSLEDTRSEARRLRQINAGLEEQLRLEIEARDDILDKWAADQARSFAFMKGTVSSERRSAKVRAANWDLRSDDLMSDGTAVNGSEPITPVSMTRFVDVEVGRGKNRKRVDSGIGILSEEDLLEDEDISDLRRGLDSDGIELPTSDLAEV